MNGGGFASAAGLIWPTVDWAELSGDEPGGPPGWCDDGLAGGGVDVDGPAVVGALVAFGFHEPVVVGAQQHQVACEVLVCPHDGHGAGGGDFHANQ